MSRMESPFDERPTGEPPPQPTRKRRPWWRWNLVTLMVVLFTLVWVRELARIDVDATWTLVFLITGVWFLVPFGFAPSVLTSMPAAPVGSPKAGAASAPWSDRLLIVFRGVSLVVLGLSCVHLLYALWGLAGSFQFWGAGFLGRPEVIFSLLAPLLECVAGATLFTLVEIALRLGQRGTA